MHLRTLARVDDEVTLEVVGPITQRAILDALEARYPVLCGTIRDHVTQQRRPFLRFFACEEDWSHELPDAPLPSKVATGAEPFLVVGAMAGWIVDGELAAEPVHHNARLARGPGLSGVLACVTRILAGARTICWSCSNQLAQGGERSVRSGPHRRCAPLARWYLHTNLRVGSGVDNVRIPPLSRGVKVSDGPFCCATMSAA